MAITDEEVYSWGDNSCGQLGNRTFRSSALPSEVVDLAGAGVCQVACGEEHTLFVCRDGEVYGCGSSAHGQLPAATPDPDTSRAAAAGGMLLATPTRLRLSFLERGAMCGPHAPVVSAVVAGAHCSAFLTRAADELPDQAAPRLWERLQAAVAAAHDAPNNLEADAHVRPIAAAVERIFSSAAAISAAFGLKDMVGMDVVLLEGMQRSILELEPPAAPKKDDPQPTQDSLFQVGACGGQGGRRWDRRHSKLRARTGTRRSMSAGEFAEPSPPPLQRQQALVCRLPFRALLARLARGVMPSNSLSFSPPPPLCPLPRPSARPWTCW